MWRELSDEEKQRHMEDFTKDKVRYDDELQGYLKSQGLRSLKSKTKKKPEPKAPAINPAPVVRREPSSSISAQPPPAHSTPAATQQQQLAQAFMGLPIAGMGGGLPMAVGMPPGMMGMLPHFSQYVGGQPVMQLQLSAQQQAAAGAQELYANGYADSAAAASASSKQMAPPRQSSTDYRYPQNYN
jgi:predicted lipid-binding transport protein (Tim44 family)